MSKEGSRVSDSRSATPEHRAMYVRHPGLVTAGIFAVIFVAHSISPTPQSGDSRLSAVTAWQFITHLNLHLEGYSVVQALGRRPDIVDFNGHWLPYFPWPTMILAAPIGLLFALVGHGPSTLSISDPSMVWLIEVPTASAMIAASALLIRAIVRRSSRQWTSDRLGTLTAFIFAFGTSAWSVASRALWQQTSSILFLALLVFALQRLGTSGQVRWLWSVLAGVGAGLAVVCRPTNAVPVLLLAIWLCWRRTRSLPGAALGVAIILGPFLLVSRAEYGSFLPPYYLPTRLEEAGMPFWESFWVNLLSPNRGLMIFDPVVLLAIAGTVLLLRRRWLTSLEATMAVACIAHLFVIASYGSTGGSAYGPRLMIDILPFLMVLAAPMIRLISKTALLRPPAHKVLTVVVIALIGWGVFVNATGALMRSGFCWSATPIHIDDAPDRVWDWSDPQFLRPYREILGGTPVTQVVAGSCSRQ